MNKNLKLSFILLSIAFAIVVAWRTLHNFFGGVGLNFVALVSILAILIGISLTNKFVFNRIKEMFFILCGLTLLEFIVYFAFDFAVKSTSHFAGFLVFQNVLSVFGIIFLMYALFRFIAEIKEVKIGFIEFILGNGKISKQQKKAKELTNGTLEEKPNTIKEEANNSQTNLSSIEETKDEE